VKNKRSQSPIDVAVAGGRGEVLNALLLACAGEGSSTVAVAAMRALLAAGAVPDTWAPNGSSALMLAAAANGVAAMKVGVVVGMWSV
jgi:ankyrin repeat protein